MAYADLGDVKARAGKFARAWTATSSPSDTDIERFCDDVSGTVDAILGSHGVETPVTDAATAIALRGVVADGALLLALEPTFPGNSAPTAAADFIQRIQDRHTAALDDLASEDSVFVQVLVQEGGSVLGADSLWSSPGDPEDVIVYDPVTRRYEASANIPLVRRGMIF